MDRHRGLARKAAGDHEDHAEQRQAKRRDPPAVERLVAHRRADDRHERRVRVEREQRDGDRCQVEGEEHRDVQPKAGDPDQDQRDPIRDRKAAGAHERDASRREPRRDHGEDDQQTERRPPGDERRRIESGLVGEPGQRPQDPEARRGQDDGQGAEQEGPVTHRRMVRVGGCDPG